jgi:hypothetical protein
LFSIVEGGKVDLYRRMMPPSLPGLFFADLVQPVGATIPLVEVQARWIAAVLAGKLALPASVLMTREIDALHEREQRTWLDSACDTLEVDAKSYAAALRTDRLPGRRVGGHVSGRGARRIVRQAIMRSSLREAFDLGRRTLQALLRHRHAAAMRSRWALKKREKQR